MYLKMKRSNYFSHPFSFLHSPPSLRVVAQQQIPPYPHPPNRLSITPSITPPPTYPPSSPSTSHLSSVPLSSSVPKEMDRRVKRTTSQRHTVKASKAQWGTVGLSLMLAKTSMLQKMGKMEATVSFNHLSPLSFHLSSPSLPPHSSPLFY